MVKVSTAELVNEFIATCRKEGWRYSFHGQVITIHKNFTPNDKEAYADCDMSAYGIICKAPASGGSIWGTDGGSIGGVVGCQGGYYTLNRSGVSKRFMAELAKRRQ